MPVLGLPEVPLSQPIPGEVVDSVRLKVRRHGEKFRRVIAKAIEGEDGPRIRLGKHAEVRSVSGGAAIDSDSHEILEVKPVNVALILRGAQMYRHDLGKDTPIDNFWVKTNEQ